MPTWGPDLSGLNLDEIAFMHAPPQVDQKRWEDVPDNIKNTFDRCASRRRTKILSWRRSIRSGNGLP